jgi:hypothetical protein
MVYVYVLASYQWYQMVEYSSTMVPWYVRTYVHVYVQIYNIISKTYIFSKTPWVHVYQWYTCTNIYGTRVRRSRSTRVYSSTMKKMVPFGTTGSIRVPFGIRSTIGTMARTCTYTCTNTTLSQKQLEIQALRCNGDTML